MSAEREKTGEIWINLRAFGAFARRDVRGPSRKLLVTISKFA
jgi:hypothetical protein